MINVKNVSKRYGKSTAIDNISIDIEENKIYCLLGCNGAGKTTLMKMIAGHISTSSGDIQVNGNCVSTKTVPYDISFIDNRATQFNITLEKLVLMASKFDERFDIDFALKMLKKFHLDKDRKFGQLSFGMQTMFNTLLSLASNRKIVLLDEPLLGLDAIMRNKFYKLLNDSFENNPKTIIISSHLIDEMTKSAAELIILDKGKILFCSTMNDIDEKAYSITGSTKAITPVVKDLNVIRQKTFGRHTTANVFDKRIASQEGLSTQSIGLQEFFINLIGEDYDDE